jgi:FKBP-type peptidyl-prolyl cis-trans isomerase SlyD
MQISANKVVSIHYTLKNDAGDILDSSAGGEPLAYLQGYGNIVPGLEKALEGRASGDKLNVRVAPEEGYGARQSALVQDVPREAFEGVDEIVPGMQFHAQGPAGMLVVTVVEANDETVTVDGNHPLAGETLHFDIEVTGVRDATEEEREHGHVHGAGGHHHHD